MAEEHIYDIGNTYPASFLDSDKFFDESFGSIFNRKELLATGRSNGVQQALNHVEKF